MNEQLTIKDMLDMIYGRNTKSTSKSTNQCHVTPHSTTINAPIINNNFSVNNITIVRNELVEQKVCNENSTTIIQEDSIEDRIRQMIRSF